MNLNTDKLNKNTSRLYNPGAYAIQQQPQQQQQDGFGGPGGIAMSPPQPFQSSVPFDPSVGGNQQQPWFGTSIDNNAFSPTSPKIIPRDLIISPSNSTSHNTDAMYHTGEEDEVQQRHMQEMFDKRRRRRESHNLVERRRRDNINERIQGKHIFFSGRSLTYFMIELCTLLPNHLLEGNPSSVHVVAGSQRSPNMINKGTILKLSVEHIKELRDQVIHYQQKVRELEQVIHQGKLVDVNINHLQQQQYLGNPSYNEHHHHHHPLPHPTQSSPQLLDTSKNHQAMRSSASTTTTTSFQGHHPFSALANSDPF
ncbi:unnamed protein product [Absidia cylindrospora]